MKGGEGNLQVIDYDVDVILENCPITIVMLNLLVYKQYSTVQYHSNNRVYDSKCHQTIPQHIMSYYVVH